MQNIQKAIASWLPNEKIMTLSRHNDGVAVLRRAGSQKQRYVKHRNMRPYILAEVIDYTADVEVNIVTEHVSQALICTSNTSDGYLVLIQV
jgi:pre-rRNA-processing protein TSR1